MKLYQSASIARLRRRNSKIVSKVSTDRNFDLWQLLWATFHLIGKVRSRELTKDGISARSAGVLLISLKLGKGATPAALHREFFVERHTISEQLTRMERDGLIKKVKDLDRKNSIRVEVTDLGFEVYRKSTKRKSIKSIMSVLNQEEQHELQFLLSKLRDKAIEHLGIEDIPESEINPD
jgi:DNA-binding MarR family transcriptional regulator